MREIKVGQVYCLNGHKKWEVTVIFVTKTKLLFTDLQGEEALITKEAFQEDYTFLRYNKADAR